MIQQIDTLTRIANSFSDFASLNVQNEELFYIEEEVRRIVNLFKNNNVGFVSRGKHLKEVKVCIDKSHLTRVLNNLVKNSLQAPKKNIPIIPTRTRVVLLSEKQFQSKIIQTLHIS